jgi:hypothetical protein
MIPAPSKGRHVTGAKPCGATTRIIPTSAVSSPQEYRRDTAPGEPGLPVAGSGYNSPLGAPRFLKTDSSRIEVFETAGDNMTPKFIAHKHVSCRKIRPPLLKFNMGEDMFLALFLLAIEACFMLSLFAFFILNIFSTGSAL